MSPKTLSLRQQHAVLVSASLVSHRDKTLAAVLQAALTEAFTPSEVTEFILQSLLFDGYPCALEGLTVLREITGADPPEPELFEPYSLENINLWRKRGEALCRRIYRTNYEPLLSNVHQLSPSLKEWMLMEGYGRILSRPTLSPDLRELGIVAILVVKNLPRQLHSHLRGALHVGVSVAALSAAVRLCTPFTTKRNLQSALIIIEKLNQLTD